MTYSPVGREIERVDGRLKVTGSAEYSGDYQASGTVYAHVVTSTIGRGTLTGIDTGAALASPGVLRVYAAPDPRLKLYPVAAQFRGFVENYVPLQDTTVHFH